MIILALKMISFAIFIILTCLERKALKYSLILDSEYYGSLFFPGLTIKDSYFGSSVFCSKTSSIMSQNLSEKEHRHADKNFFWVKRPHLFYSIYWPKKLNDHEYATLLSSHNAQCVSYENENKNEMIKAGLNELTTTAKKVFKGMILEAEGLPTDRAEDEDDAIFFEKILFPGSNQINNGSNLVPDLSITSSTSLATASSPSILRISMFNGPIKRTINNFYNETPTSSAETASSSTSFIGEPLQKKFNSGDHFCNQGQGPFPAAAAADASQKNPYFPRLHAGLGQNVQRNRLYGVNMDRFDVRGQSIPILKPNSTPTGSFNSKSEEVERLQKEILALQGQNMTLAKEKLKLSQQIIDMKQSYQKILEGKNSEVKVLELKVNELVKIKNNKEVEIVALKIKSEGSSKSDNKLKLKSDEINRKNTILRQLKDHIEQEFQKLLPNDIEIE